LAGVAFLVDGAAGGAVAAGAVPGSGAAEFGDGVAAQAVFDAEPVCGGEVAVVDVAVLAGLGGGYSERVEEAGAATGLAQRAGLDGKTLADLGGGHKSSGGEEVLLDLECEVHGKKAEMLKI
jgi:hypothetical protein